MCGRFSRGQDQEAIEARFELAPGGPPAPASYNIAPGQDVPVVVAGTGGRELRLLRWGLTPSWAKDPGGGPRPINARAETAASKPAFRFALKRRRCLVPADGFYEWRAGGKGRPKQPYFFQLKDGGLFALAGLWEVWRPPEGEGGELVSFAILTTRANDLVGEIHERMPVILDPGNEAAWLEMGEKDPAELETLMAPYPTEKMQAHPVSPRVNFINVNEPGLIEPVPEEKGLFD